ncbi:Seryl-tRNA synthetase [Mycoplasmopsis meleagridis]|uniref:serine--tRNA ligase n=1 Tax=Mycoplasmopsis meleagridis TaxID=29561 RepID=UPI000615172B|nr:serine--tRNA ligase [Mycoplasmopsis meleagridis]KUH47595.1 serine--tRNA ligase [Mycoplasmopsis meleagridis]OAD18178.1 Seryl-tRNA synthetase [Mycoplasmopsis meleagridis]
MLNLKYLIDNEKEVRELFKTRKVDFELLDKLFSIAKMRGKLMFEAQQKKALLISKSKNLSKEKTNKDKFEMLKNELSILKKEQIILEKKADDLDIEVKDIINKIPNLPLKDVPLGEDDSQNIVLKTHDNLGRGLISKNVKPHYEIAHELGLFDTERASKLSGSRFVIYKDDGARLARALQNYLLDLHSNNNYQEIDVPVLVKPNIMYGTGQLPKFKEDLFYLEKENLYLIPTAEVPVTNLYNNEIIDLSKPIKLTAFTPCFRSEAGSGGKDTKGIIRLHQFKKVELVKITSKKDALEEFDQLLEQAKLVLENLELPYRELLLCRGDLGFSSKKTIDLEVWLPSEMKYREISSVSYMGDFQARRAMIRYRNSEGEIEYAHTMNGSGLAIDRLIAAILENYQQEDGSIIVPKKLVPYMQGKEKIEK